MSRILGFLRGLARRVKELDPIALHMAELQAYYRERQETFAEADRLNRIRRECKSLGIPLLPVSDRIKPYVHVWDDDQREGGEK